MSDDPDLPKANYALRVLRQARLSRNETAARMVEHLAYVTTNTGLRPPEIEETQQAARVAISELANALKEEEFAGPTLWKAWRMLSKKKSLLGPLSGKPRSELPRAG